MLLVLVSGLSCFAFFSSSEFKYFFNLLISIIPVCIIQPPQECLCAVNVLLCLLRMCYSFCCGHVTLLALQVSSYGPTWMCYSFCCGRVTLLALQAASYGPTWIAFTVLTTPHFMSSNIILTSVVPPACADSSLLPVNFANGEAKNIIV